jgi:3-isopropylmalate/(R)-2-methylmalate dehydratase large subunit
MPNDALRFAGRILFLTEDATLLRQQLDGTPLSREVVNEIIAGGGPKLVDNISTDEITPGWVCYYYDETLGEYSLVGLRGRVIQRGDIKNGGFDVIVSGQSKGCGSSRETAPYSEVLSGRSPRRREEHREDLRAELPEHRPLTTTDFSVLGRILERGEEIPLDEFTKGLDPISADIVRSGALLLQQEAAGRRDRAAHHHHRRSDR